MLVYQRVQQNDEAEDEDDDDDGDDDGDDDDDEDEDEDEDVDEFNDTVDGRIPAPVDSSFIPLFTVSGFNTVNMFQPFSVVLDFFHSQYFMWVSGMPKKSTKLSFF
jgi:hypothetical protein